MLSGEAAYTGVVVDVERDRNESRGSSCRAHLTDRVDQALDKYPEVRVRRPERDSFYTCNEPFCRKVAGYVVEGVTPE